jgi:hypothetical protein
MAGQYGRWAMILSDYEFAIVAQLQLQFLRIKKHFPCAYSEGEKEQTVTAWEHMIVYIDPSLPLLHRKQGQ